jgi:hypothetical protein
MTLREIRDQIKIDANVLSDINFTNVRLNNIINQAQRYVQTELNGLGMKKWEEDGVLAVVALTYAGIDVARSPVPTDMLESPKSIIQIQVNDDNGGSIEYGIAKEVDKNSFLDVARNAFLAPTISQPVFMRLSNYIFLVPSEIVGATAYYYKVIPELTADGTESNMPEEFIEYVIRRGVSQIDKILGRLNEAISKEKDLSNDIAEAYNRFVGKMNTEKTVEKLQ